MASPTPPPAPACPGLRTSGHTHPACPARTSGPPRHASSLRAPPLPGAVAASREATAAANRSAPSRSPAVVDPGSPRPRRYEGGEAEEAGPELERRFFGEILRSPGPVSWG